MLERAVQRILVPIELADSEHTQVDYALRLAHQLHAELVLLAVIDSPAIVELIGHHRAQAKRTDSFHMSLVDDAKGILQGIVDLASKHGVKALGHATVSEEVEEQILKEAVVQKVDLILVRSSGRSGFMKLLLGTRAGDILKAAPCPVLVAHQHP